MKAKQHFIRVEYENRVAATDEIIYRNFSGSWSSASEMFATMAGRQCAARRHIVVNAAR